MQRKLIIITVAFISSFHILIAQEVIEKDSIFSKQKKLFEKLEVLKAWEITKGSSSIIIGCIDNGFDFYHPYLRENLIPGCYEDKVYHPMTFQTMAHGTLVASLMIANPVNEIGMYGLAPDCKVLTASIGSMEHYILKKRQEILKNTPQMPLADIMKEMSKDSVMINTFSYQWNEFSGIAVAKGIMYLVKNGVKVINISAEIMVQYSKHTQEKINEAIDYARQQDVLLVIAAGNGNKEIPNMLRSYDNVIIVSASTLNDMRWIINNVQGSNWGSLLDVCAPVDELLVCQPSDKRFYDANDGPMGAEHIPYEGKIYDVMPYGATSAAVPIVSSLAALIYSIDPEIKASAVKSLIIKGCDDINEEGFDNYTGHGRVNFGKTIDLVLDERK